ncbi:MAG: ABC transporter ATP-binding protein [Clostridia bacterium]|nr:ABC transporter ATP-binding protein [Clostridia bacterium]
MSEIMIKIDNISKEYKLGQIGGTTFQDEVQRFFAKLFKKEDPTRKIGAKKYGKNEKLLALDGVSFEINKGERVGLIGNNGAGKSTLLKLISRITSPTKGEIGLNGRVVSMLEVGTGFHPDLTGRENIYMNGAILGMTKKEIDSKIEDIIEFSEIREFIDTPVKRYSSGMYVKLAFSVVSHLDSEIIIMDEVLAVGDIQFQKKCIEKINSVSEEKNRTVLYVSHNMSTIRQLCNRVIVLDKGKVIFDGNTEEGIKTYENLPKNK